MTTEDKNQDQQIGDITKELKTKVPWNVFVWAIGIIVVLMGVALTSATAAKDSVSDVQGDIKAINATLEGMDKSLDLILNSFNLTSYNGTKR